MLAIAIRLYFKQLSDIAGNSSPAGIAFFRAKIQLDLHCRKQLTKNELAIQGGVALLRDAQPNWPTASQAIREVVAMALEDGSWGKYESRWSTILFEKLQRYFQCEHILPCCSGTIAVELAIRAVGVSPATK